MRYFTSHLIYSTAIMPASLNALIRVLGIIDEEFAELSRKLWKHTSRLKVALESSGYKLTQSESPINSICTGNSVETLKMAKLLFEEGILATPFIYPSVPLDCGRIRLIAGANLKDSSIDKAIKIFKALMYETH
jgi:7-keto-8-aminopelargonate synthetase-like enzyme